MGQFIIRALRWAEIFGALVTLAAVLFKIANLPMAPDLFIIGMMTLACAYFFSANTEQQKSDQPKMGFSDLLVGIVRKIMFIGLSVLLVAYLFTVLHLHGANEMLIIGLLTLIICLVVGMGLVLAKRERMALLQSPMVRSLVALLFYFATPLLR